LLPENPAARSEALAAISSAELITMGPGSWISSVLPHLMVPAQRDAIVNSKAKKVLLLNLDANVLTAGDEYAGYSAEDHLHLFHKYAPELKVDYVVADSDVVTDRLALEKIVTSLGGALISADLSMGPGSSAHDVRKMNSPDSQLPNLAAVKLRFLRSYVSQVVYISLLAKLWLKLN
jgi:2-phospho-L-lactate transferase/gluconeogenesis factor (CofD/UPF0052 family)